MCSVNYEFLLACECQDDFSMKMQSSHLPSLPTPLLAVRSLCDVQENLRHKIFTNLLLSSVIKFQKVMLSKAHSPKGQQRNHLQCIYWCKNTTQIRKAEALAKRSIYRTMYDKYYNPTWQCSAHSRSPQQHTFCDQIVIYVCVSASAGFHLYTRRAGRKFSFQSDYCMIQVDNCIENLCTLHCGKFWGMQPSSL